MSTDGFHDDWSLGTEEEDSCRLVPRVLSLTQSVEVWPNLTEFLLTSPSCPLVDPIGRGSDLTWQNFCWLIPHVLSLTQSVEGLTWHNFCWIVFILNRVYTESCLYDWIVFILNLVYTIESCLYDWIVFIPFSRNSVRSDPQYINQTKSTIPACPCLMCFCNKGDI